MKIRDEILEKANQMLTEKCEDYEYVFTDDERKFIIELIEEWSIKLNKPDVSNWPDDARLDMIDKSNIYGQDKNIYQYGFYDGYQRAIKACC